MTSILGKGAEAVLVREGTTVCKERGVKAYRHPELDRTLRTFRTRREAKILETLHRAGVPVPAVKRFDDRACVIVMDFLDGPKLKDVLAQDPERYGREVGILIGRMHEKGVIHGDLSTSNMIASPPGIVLIDFGLGSFSNAGEHRAVDLHVLEQIVHANHTLVASEFWRAFATAYEGSFFEAPAVLKRLEAVRKRGRNKMKF